VKRDLPRVGEAPERQRCSNVKRRTFAEIADCDEREAGAHVLHIERHPWQDREQACPS